MLEGVKCNSQSNILLLLLGQLKMNCDFVPTALITKFDRVAFHVMEKKKRKLSIREGDRTPPQMQTACVP